MLSAPDDKAISTISDVVIQDLVDTVALQFQRRLYLVIKFKCHTGFVWYATFPIHGTRIVLGSEDVRVRMWDAPTDGPPLEGWLRYLTAVNAITFTPYFFFVADSIDKQTTS